MYGISITSKQINEMHSDIDTHNQWYRIKLYNGNIIYQIYFI